MKLAQIVTQSDDELRKLLETSYVELAEAMVELRTQKAPNVKKISNIKRTIARALTIERQRQLTEPETNNQPKTIKEQSSATKRKK